MTTHARDAASGPGPLPDLLGLSLAELRRLDHPVLREVLAELRERVAGKQEVVAGFTQYESVPEPSPPRK